MPWLQRLFYPRAQAKTKKPGEPAAESPGTGPPSASSTIPQQNSPNLPEDLDVEAIIEPTKPCSQEQERASPTGEVASVSPSESATLHPPQPTGPGAAHEVLGYDIATCDFAESPPSSSNQQKTDVMKEIVGEGGSEGSEHTPTKVESEEVRTQLPHATNVNHTPQPPLQIMTKSLPADDKSSPLEEPTADASTVGHQDHNVDPISPHNPVNSGPISKDTNHLGPEPSSIVSTQGLSDDTHPRPAPYPTKEDKTLVLNQRLDELKLETEFQDEHVIHRVGTWEKGNSAKSWTTSRWKKKEIIGSGSFGTVWLQEKVEYHPQGVRRGIGQLRAVKTVPRDLSQGTISQELLAFAKLKQFDHLFVNFHGWYEDADNTFIVMEYVGHGDLNQYIQRSRQSEGASRYSLMEVKEITRQILEGLEVLHSKKIYHRDLKPQNILIASLDPIWIKIADFGVSKLAKNTALRTRAGTDGYFAPEIVGCINRRKLKGQGLIPHALDIWSLGCLVYELLAFEPPFLNQELDEGGELLSGFQAWSTGIRQSDFQSLRDYCHDELEFPVALLKQSELPVGDEEEAFIQSLLNPNPADRPTAASALRSPWLAGLRYRSVEVESWKKEFLQLGVELDFGKEDILLRQCGTENISRFLPKSEKRTILDLVLVAGRGGNNKALSRLLESLDCPESVDSEFKKTLLQQAVESGLLDTVKLLLESTLYLGACVGENSLLYWALDLAIDNVEMAELILNHASDVQSALLLAVRSGKAKMVRSILAADPKNDNLPKNGIERRAALQEAIGAGNLGITMLLLDEETNVNIAAEYCVGGRTLLQSAAESGDIEIVNLLLDHGANVNAKAGDENGRTALQAAAERGHMNIVKLLLKKGANVNAGTSNHNGRRALQGAAGGGHIDIVKLLLDHGANVNAKAAPFGGRTALQAAVGGGHIDIIDLLLRHNADVNALGSKDRDGRTALQLAAEDGHVEIVKLLLEKNATVNAPARGENGLTALEAAAGGGNLELSKILLENGAVVFNPTEPNEIYSNKGALEAAAREGHFDVVELLLSAAGVNLVISSYNCPELVGPLTAAAGSGHINILKLLLDKLKLALLSDDSIFVMKYHLSKAIDWAARGGHLEVLELLVDDEYWGEDARFESSSLSYAASDGHTNIVRVLLKMDRGLSHNDKISAARQAIERKQFETFQLFLETNQGAQQNTDMLVLAAREGLIDCVRLLLANGVDIEPRYSSLNLTPIQAAAGGGHLDVCILLLDNKADVNATARKGGRTALQAAAEGGHVEVVRFLLDNHAEISVPKEDDCDITALEAAVKSGSTTIARMLLEGHAGVGILYQGNPLEHAAGAGRLDLVKLFLDYGANVNGNYPGRPPLHSAAESGHVDIVKLLLDHDADCHRLGFEWVHALTLAASSGRIELAKLLFEVECDYSPSTVKNMLEAAAGKNHLDMVSFIFHNAIDSVFKTDLHSNYDNWGKILEIACWTAHTDLVQLVLENMKKNNVDVVNSCESLALSQAVERGHIHIVKLLLRYGADPSLKNRDGKATLQAAAENGDLEMIELLLDSMIHSNDLPHIHLALYAAVENGNIDILRLLLDHPGGNINVNTRVQGNTLLHLAVESGEIEIARLLLAHGADVNAVSYSTALSTLLRGPSYAKYHTAGYVTVLQLALFSGHVDIIKLIASQKALANFIAV